jgi:hypothetical protein
MDVYIRLVILWNLLNKQRKAMAKSYPENDPETNIENRKSRSFIQNSIHSIRKIMRILLVFGTAGGIGASIESYKTHSAHGMTLLENEQTDENTQTMTGSRDEFSPQKWEDLIRDLKEKGVIPGTFSEEKEHKPDMTEKEYWKLLAEKLNTLQKWDMYILSSFRDDRSDESLYWQSADETLHRTQKFSTAPGYPPRWQMLADCEDVGLFAEKVRQKQKLPAHTMFIKSTEGTHAFCIWTEYTQKKTYQCITIDQDGVLVNGRSIYDQKEEEFTSVEDAINASLCAFTGQTKNNFDPAKIPVFREYPDGSIFLDAITIHNLKPDGIRTPSYTNFGALALATGGAAFLLSKASQIRRKKKKMKQSQYS